VLGSVKVKCSEVFRSETYRGCNLKHSDLGRHLSIPPFEIPGQSVSYSSRCYDSNLDLFVLMESDSHLCLSSRFSTTFLDQNLDCDPGDHEGGAKYPSKSGLINKHIVKHIGPSKSGLRNKHTVKHTVAWSVFDKF